MSPAPTSSPTTSGRGPGSIEVRAELPIVVNAWWGSFDIAVTFFSGDPAEPPSQDFIFRNAMDAQEITVGWWPGYFKYPKAAFYAYAHPAAAGLASAPT